MFQPHSVRGLLSRRNVSRKTEQSSSQLANTSKDPDLQSGIEAKLIIKDIEHQIDDIRKWRQHQKSLLNQKLASNKAVVDVMKENYQKNASEDTQRDLLQKINTLKKLEMLKYLQESEQKASEELRGDTNLFQYITNSNKSVDQFKYGAQTGDNYQLAEQKMLSQIEQLREMMNSKVGVTQISQNKKNVDKSLLKQELDQIDAQLREVEDLLKD